MAKGRKGAPQRPLATTNPQPAGQESGSVGRAAATATATQALGDLVDALQQLINLHPASGSSGELGAGAKSAQRRANAAPGNSAPGPEPGQAAGADDSGSSANAGAAAGGSASNVSSIDFSMIVNALLQGSLSTGLGLDGGANDDVGADDLGLGTVDKVPPGMLQSVLDGDSLRRLAGLLEATVESALSAGSADPHWESLSDASLGSTSPPSASNASGDRPSATPAAAEPDAAPVHLPREPGSSSCSAAAADAERPGVPLVRGSLIRLPLHSLDAVASTVESLSASLLRLATYGVATSTEGSRGALRPSPAARGGGAPGPGSREQAPLAPEVAARVQPSEVRMLHYPLWNIPKASAAVVELLVCALQVRGLVWQGLHEPGLSDSGFLDPPGAWGTRAHSTCLGTSTSNPMVALTGSSQGATHALRMSHDVPACLHATTAALGCACTVYTCRCSLSSSHARMPLTLQDRAAAWDALAQGAQPSHELLWDIEVGAPLSPLLLLPRQCKAACGGQLVAARGRVHTCTALGSISGAALRPCPTHGLLALLHLSARSVSRRVAVAPSVARCLCSLHRWWRLCLLTAPLSRHLLSGCSTPSCCPGPELTPLR